MAFELRPRKSTGRGLARLARRQVHASRVELGRRAKPTEDAIHETRKRVKKARAILFLVDADHGRGIAKSRKRLRSVNRILSCVRDAGATIETLRTLHEHHPELLSEHAYARLRRDASQSKEALTRKASRDGAWRRASRLLRKLERAAGRWRPDHDGFKALAPGIRKTHRRARRALARAKETHAAADFHEWRKATKALWYQLRLAGGGTAAIARDTRALHSAETWLGEDHNLVVLCEQLSGDPSVCPSAMDVSRLRCAVDAIQQNLRRQAIARTRAIFSIRSRAYVRRVERAWDARKRRDTRRSPRRAA
jgi:CHAD domain-containing protein